MMNTAVATWSFNTVAASSERECTVCLEAKEQEDFPNAPLSDNYSHALSTCLDCVKACIGFDLDNSPLLYPKVALSNFHVRA